MFNPDRQLSGITKTFEVPKVIKGVLDEMKEDRLDYSGFEEYYSPEDIKQDQEKAVSIQQGFKDKEAKKNTSERNYLRQMKQKSEIFEAFIYSQASQADWFGKHTALIVTKEIDDLINGVDLLLEHEEGEQKKYIGLALDVTFNATSEGVKNKLGRIETEVRGGNLSKVKYAETNEGAGLDHVPRLVIGVQQERVDRLNSLWVDKEGASQEARELNNSLIRKHYAQVVILLQMKHQLEIFEKLARSNSREETTLKLGEASKFVNRLLDEKKDIYTAHKDKIEKDPVLQIVKGYAKDLERGISVDEEIKSQSYD